MKLIKGFVEVSNLVLNSPVGTVNVIGELSTYSSTFSKDKGVYTHASYPGLTLHAFKSIDEDTQVHYAPINNDVLALTLGIVSASLSYFSVNSPPYNNNSYRNYITSAFPGQILDFQFGPFVNGSGQTLPTWFSFKNSSNNHTVKIWLSDLAFRDYDEYEIVVIPPLDPVDNFFQTYNTVVTAINNIDQVELGDQIDTIANLKPYSHRRTLAFDFVNVLNPSQKTKTYWNYLIYGPAGDNIDSLKDATIDHLLSNSSMTSTQWEAILPDIFKRTEFLIFPMWHKVAIPNLSELSAVYSSIMSLSDVKQFYTDSISIVNSIQRDNRLELTPFDYKCVMLSSVSGTGNDTSVNLLSKVFPDYIPVASTSTDWMRMSIKTREWSLKINSILQAAESDSSLNAIDTAYMRRVNRNGYSFIGMLYDNINYLVATRSNSIYQE